MALFSRRKKSAPEEEPQETVETSAEPVTTGPFDITDVDSVEGMHNFGVLNLPMEPGTRVQFTINKRTRAAMGALVQMAGSTLSINVYAAPKSAGLWPDIRDELSETIVAGGGTANFREGPFGPEIEAMVPKKEVNEVRHVRYVGVDGPRWLLRAAIEGEAVSNADTRELVYAYLRKVVVDRGSDPYPVRDQLELTMPDSARARVEEKLGKPVQRKARGPELPELR